MADSDPFVAQLLELRRRRVRDKAKLALVEGVRFAIRALEAGITIESVVVGPQLASNPHGGRLVERCTRTGARLTHLSAVDFRRVSAMKSPDGIALVIRQRWGSLDQAATRGIWLAFDAVRSPGNLGCILRTCESAAAAGVVFIGSRTDPFDPATVRATMGSLFSQQLIRTTFDDLKRWIRRTGCQVVGTSAEANRDFRLLRYTEPTMFMIGCERGGMSRQQEALCEAAVRIPMGGQADSLDVAVAASLLLYEALRQLSPPRRR